MNIVYPREEFFRHQEAWQSKYHSIERVTFDGGTVDLEDFPAEVASVLKTRYMMLAEGVHASEEGKKAKAFQLIQMFLCNHMEALFEAGLVRLHDGTNAVVKPETLAAIHEAFLSDPPPHPDAVSIDQVVMRAREIDEDYKSRS